MDNHFEIVFIKECFDFLQKEERKQDEKILYNIRRVQVENDSQLF